jgi:hypothetical protein
LTVRFAVGGDVSADGAVGGCGVVLVVEALPDVDGFRAWFGLENGVDVLDEVM